MRRRRTRPVRARAARHRVPADERAASCATCCASSSGTGRCSRATSRTTRRDPGETHRWYGSRSVALMLEILHGRGVDRRRRAARRAATLGSRRALVPGGRDACPLRDGRAAPRRAALPRAGRPAHESGLGGASRCSGRSGPGPRDAFSPRSTASSTTATAPRRSSTSATASRCTCRRRSASTATTSCRSSSATASSAASSRCFDRRTGTLEVRRRLGRHVARGRGAREPRRVPRRRGVRST